MLETLLDDGLHQDLHVCNFMALHGGYSLFGLNGGRSKYLQNSPNERCAIPCISTRLGSNRSPEVLPVIKPWK